MAVLQQEETWPDFIFLDYQMNVGDSGDEVRLGTQAAGACMMGAIDTSLWSLADMPENEGGIWSSPHPHRHVHGDDWGIASIGRLQGSRGHGFPAEAV